MSVMILRKRFEAPPSRDEILGLLVGDNVGDKGKAKDALVNLLAPMKDLLALYQFVDTMDKAAVNYADMLKEQETVAADLTSTKSQIAAAKASYNKTVESQIAKLGELSNKIAELEKAKTALEDEQAARDRLNKSVMDEVAATKRFMLGEVDKEVAVAREKLISLNTSITASETELSAMEEKKRKFIASLGG